MTAKPIDIAKTSISARAMAGGEPAYFKGLNPEQRDAVESTEGPLLVLAGAGTGKTSTLAHRVARLFRDGADPQRLLLLTFSRRAAAMLERRAGQALRALGAAVAGFVIGGGIAAIIGRRRR